MSSLTASKGLHHFEDTQTQPPAWEPPWEIQRAYAYKGIPLATDMPYRAPESVWEHVSALWSYGVISNMPWNASEWPVMAS